MYKILNQLAHMNPIGLITLGAGLLGMAAAVISIALHLI